MHVHVCTTSNSQLIVRTWFRVIIEIVRSQAQFGVCDRVILRCVFMMDSECINQVDAVRLYVEVGKKAPLHVY